MVKDIVLATNSTLLHVSVENPDGTLEIQNDENATLIVGTMDQSCISAVKVTLISDNQQVDFPIPCSGKKTSERIRLDTYFSLVFSVDETIQSITIDNEALMSLIMENNKPRVFLVIRLETNTENLASKNRPALVHTASLLIGNNYIPVSREILIYGSDFFQSFFDGNYFEKQSGIFELKDVDVDEFTWFICSFIFKQWKFDSVERALMALRYADRFGFLRLHTQIFPYLKTQKISSSLLADTLILCGRFDDNEQIIRWIFKQCQEESDVYKLLHDCTPNLPARSIQSALKAMEKDLFQRKMRDRVKSEDSLWSDALPDEGLGIVLVTHEEEEDIVGVNSFHVYSYYEPTFEMNVIWDHLPPQYNLVKFEYDAKEYRRENPDDYECERTYRTMQAHAYIATAEYIPDEESDSESSSSQMERNEISRDDYDEFYDSLGDEGFGIHLMLHGRVDATEIVENEFFSPSLSHERAVGTDEIWAALPDEYKVVIIPDHDITLRRDDSEIKWEDQKIRCKFQYRVMEMHAYISDITEPTPQSLPSLPFLPQLSLNPTQLIQLNVFNQLNQQLISNGNNTMADRLMLINQILQAQNNQ